MAYVTDLDVSTNPDQENTLLKRGFTKINVNINQGTGAKNAVFLWFIKGSDGPITRVQVTFNKEMEAEMEEADFTKINQNLNTGTEGPALYMWYSKAQGKHDVFIVDVDVTDKTFKEAAKLQSRGVWEPVCCDLNLGVGTTFVYAWLKRANPIYIHNVTATDNYEHHDALLSCGYTRVDVNTNYKTCFGAAVFIWYLKTTDEKKSLSHLDISTSKEEEEELDKKGYTKVKVNLNEDTCGVPVYLWKKKEDLDHLRAIFLLRNMEAVQQFNEAGIKVVEKDLNKRNPGAKIYLCYVV